jgi:hypothetical protein
MDLPTMTNKLGKPYSIVRPGGRGFTALINDPELLSRTYVVGAPRYPLTKESQLARPSVAGLVNALEPARSRGMFVAHQTASALVKSGYAEPLEAASGQLAPMAVLGASRAAEVDDGRREPSPQGTAARLQEDAARHTRHERLGNIFERLRRTLREPPVGEIATTKDQSAALDRLVQAFENWVRANVPAEGEEKIDSVPLLEAELQAKLVAFLIAFN